MESCIICYDEDINLILPPDCNCKCYLHLNCYEIMKNRGLTPHRKKENRNPRVKKRHQYEKAIVRRKGQVREVIAGAAGSYGGELTGIKANIARSRKIGN